MHFWTKTEVSLHQLVQCSEDKMNPYENGCTKRKKPFRYLHSFPVLF